jgi:uncharacterized protein YndB with AHSA1/START domain
MPANTAAISRPSVTIQRRYDAPPARVYAAWTKADMIVRWFGPTDARQETVKAEMDVRVGGRFTISFTKADGDSLRVTGLYKEVVPDHKLVFGWAWLTGSGHESQVTVVTTADGDGTLLTLTHEQLLDEPTRDGHRRGWSESLEKLAATLAQGRT